MDKNTIPKRSRVPPIANCLCLWWMALDRSMPSDGVVVEGESFVNEALLTGESKPVRKEMKAKVIGSAINGEGVLKVGIERIGEETYLAQVIELVRQAQESKSRTQEHEGRVIYFCSKHCEEEFKKNPKKYLLKVKE